MKNNIATCGSCKNYKDFGCDKFLKEDNTFAEKCPSYLKKENNKCQH